MSFSKVVGVVILVGASAAALPRAHAQGAPQGYSDCRRTIGAYTRPVSSAYSDCASSS